MENIYLSPDKTSFIKLTSDSNAVKREAQNIVSAVSLLAAEADKDSKIPVDICVSAILTELGIEHTLCQSVAKNEKRPILWTYDQELGIAYFCPHCNSFLCDSTKSVCTCGGEIDWKQKEYSNVDIQW